MTGRFDSGIVNTTRRCSRSKDERVSSISRVIHHAWLWRVPPWRKRVSAENNSGPNGNRTEKKRKREKKIEREERKRGNGGEEEEDKQGRKTNSAPTNRTPFVSINLVPSERQIPRFFEFLSNVSSNENEYSNPRWWKAISDICLLISIVHHECTMGGEVKRLDLLI